MLFFKRRPLAPAGIMVRVERRYDEATNTAPIVAASVEFENRIYHEFGKDGKPGTTGCSGSGLHFGAGIPIVGGHPQFETFDQMLDFALSGLYESDANRAQIKDDDWLPPEVPAEEPLAG